jgi:hypothetical protein
MLIEVDTLFGDPRKRAARESEKQSRDSSRSGYTLCFSLGTGLSLIKARTVGLITRGIGFVFFSPGVYVNEPSAPYPPHLRHCYATETRRSRERSLLDRYTQTDLRAAHM